MRLSLLGSTGSIGRNTLQVVREIETPVTVVALAAGWDVDCLVQQALEFRPELLAVADEQGLAKLRSALAGVPGYSPRCVSGPEGTLAAATDVEYDVLVSAIVGVAGLEATHAATLAGKRIGLANKEVLVAAGNLFMGAARRSGAEVLPIDSEHNAVHQCLRAGRCDEVERIILTASGGPFRRTSRLAMEAITVDRALRHPTWKMGPRITIDSATMMNKGFEVIEACHLFDLPPQKVDVVVHPQSIVHAMVEYRDGSVIAQMSPPDMKLPIRYALAHPEREQTPRERMDWSQATTLEFEPPDLSRFPLVGLAYKALEMGGAAGCLLNAADEVAVGAFLQGRISFPGIAKIVEATLSRGPSGPLDSVPDVLACDAEGRAIARTLTDRANAV